MDNVFLVDHPFISDSLGHLRNKKTDIQKFRCHSDKLCRSLFAETIRGLNFQEVEIETPLTKTKVKKFQEQIVIVPVLRSGIAMLFGAIQLLPKAQIGFVGLERDEETAIASQYYWKLPKLTKEKVIIVTDPMLATGGSILHLLQEVSKTPSKEIRVACVVAAPEGIKKIHQHFPKVKIFTAAIDDHLDDRSFIVPGLGDYGDRYFGTQN